MNTTLRVLAIANLVLVLLVLGLLAYIALQVAAPGAPLHIFGGAVPQRVASSRSRLGSGIPTSTLRSCAPRRARATNRQR